MRPRAHPCRHCPTAHFPPDPGAIDMRAGVLAGVVTPEEMLFVCGWAPSRTCRGVYDEMIALKAELAQLERRRPPSSPSVVHDPVRRPNVG